MLYYILQQFLALLKDCMKLKKKIVINIFPMNPKKLKWLRQPKRSGNPKKLGDLVSQKIAGTTANKKIISFISCIKWLCLKIKTSNRFIKSFTSHKFHMEQMKYTDKTIITGFKKEKNHPTSHKCEINDSFNSCLNHSSLLIRYTFFHISNHGHNHVCFTHQDSTICSAVLDD